MDLREPGRETPPDSPRAFATTHWSVVVAAGLDESALARSALETLCRAYWYPIYVYVRRKGYGPDDAQDLTQEFFAQLISKHHLRLAERNKGKFRTFLLTGLDYFLAREWSRAHRQKRGGQFSFISLDQQTPEERYRLEPADNDTPEKKFAREWALAVLKQAMDALERECECQRQGLPLPRSQEPVVRRARQRGVCRDQPAPGHGRGRRADGRSSVAATPRRTAAR